MSISQSCLWPLQRYGYSVCTLHMSYTFALLNVFDRNCRLLLRSFCIFDNPKEAFQRNFLFWTSMPCIRGTYVYLARVTTGFLWYLPVCWEAASQKWQWRQELHHWKKVGQYRVQWSSNVLKPRRLWQFICSHTQIHYQFTSLVIFLEGILHPTQAPLLRMYDISLARSIRSHYINLLTQSSPLYLYHYIGSPCLFRQSICMPNVVIHHDFPPDPFHQRWIAVLDSLLLKPFCPTEMYLYVPTAVIQLSRIDSTFNTILSGEAF